MRLVTYAVDLHLEAGWGSAQLFNGSFDIELHIIGTSGSLHHVAMLAVPIFDLPEPLHFGVRIPSAVPVSHDTQVVHVSCTLYNFLLTNFWWWFSLQSQMLQLSAMMTLKLKFLMTAS